MSATAPASCSTGSGRAFSAGADISEFADRDPEAIAQYYRETGGVYERVAALPQPTISAIHGYCLGGGLELALATDFRIADETAVFGFPEVGIGILPSSGRHRAGGAAARPGAGEEADPARRAAVGRRGARGRARDRGRRCGRRRSTARSSSPRTLAALPRLAVSVAKQAIDAVPESSREAALLIERLAYGLLAQTAAARDAADDRRG